MTLYVKVKHGLVKFKPLTMSLGKIENRTFETKNGHDIWTYQVAFKSLDQLNKASSGSLHLSVPIANIHDQTFEVWYEWGVKKVAHNTAADKVLAGSSSASSDKENNEPIASSPSNSTSATPSAKTSVSEPVDKSADADSAVTPADLAKYKVSPKKQTYAETALINYPFAQTILIFVILDAIVIAGAISLRRKFLKGGKNDE